MMDLNGHEAGNGGYSQGKSKVHRVSLLGDSITPYSPTQKQSTVPAGTDQENTPEARSESRSRRLSKTALVQASCYTVGHG
jgi:hypothetical protein